MELIWILTVKFEMVYLIEATQTCELEWHSTDILQNCIIVRYCPKYYHEIDLEKKKQHELFNLICINFQFKFISEQWMLSFAWQYLCEYLVSIC